jgi:TolA-binding protein
VDDLTLQSKKNLIEARILLELASIFKKVGLVDKAKGYSTEGLSKIEKILEIADKVALDRETVESAYNTKWDLLLAEGRMKEAVQVCSRLITLYPDSVLVDRALMSVAKTYAKSQQFEQAIAMFTAIQSLPKTDLRAESAFRVAETMEERAKQLAFDTGRDLNLAGAMQAYKRCSERYPESLYAGNAIDKMCEYHIDVSKNYPRVLDILEQAFVDYPDAEFLDKMLLRWVVAAYRMGRYELAMEKCQQLLSEYPDSPLIPKAVAFRKSIERKLK